MAQPQSIEVPVTIILDVTEARRILRRIIADAKTLNRELAAVEEGIATQEVQLDAHIERVRALGFIIKNGDEDV